MGKGEGLNVLKFGESVDVRYGFAGAIFTVIVFYFLNLFLFHVGLPESVTIKDSWKWRNLVISWLHALICGLWDVSCFFLYQDMFQDLISYANYPMYGLVAFSTGYFIYDFTDMVINNKAVRMWEVTVHHIAVLSIFGSNLLGCRYIAYSCVALLTEVNSIFLHSRKLLQMVGIGFDHWLYRLTVGLNLLTFVVFRGLALGGIMYGMYVWYDRVPFAYFLCLSVCMFMMNVINPILFWRLLKNDFFRKPHKRSKELDSGNLVENFTAAPDKMGVNNNIKSKTT